MKLNIYETVYYQLCGTYLDLLGATKVSIFVAETDEPLTDSQCISQQMAAEVAGLA